jgi:hypothetical protein
MDGNIQIYVFYYINITAITCKYNDIHLAVCPYYKIKRKNSGIKHIQYGSNQTPNTHKNKCYKYPVYLNCVKLVSDVRCERIVYKPNLKRTKKKIPTKKIK